MKKKLRILAVVAVLMFATNSVFAVMQTYTASFMATPSIRITKTFTYETQEDLDCQIYEWLQAWYNRNL